MTKVTFIVASDIAKRDGIGVELYCDGHLQLEVFRDDTLRKRYVSLFQDTVDIDLVEQCIHRFRQEGLWDFDDNEE